MGDYITNAGGCTCNAFRYNPKNACKHMREMGFSTVDTTVARPASPGRHAAYDKFVAVEGLDWSFEQKERYRRVKRAYDRREKKENIGGGHGLLAKYGL